jgi:hypothetical protein
MKLANLSADHFAEPRVPPLTSGKGSCRRRREIFSRTEKRSEGTIDSPLTLLMMARQDDIVEKINRRVVTLENSIENFDYARERLLEQQRTVAGADDAQLKQALLKNKEAVDALKLNLASQLEQLKKRQMPR